MGARRNHDIYSSVDSEDDFYSDDNSVSTATPELTGQSSPAMVACRRATRHTHVRSNEMSRRSMGGMDLDLVNTRPSSRLSPLVKVTKRAVAESVSSDSTSSDALEIEDMMDHRAYTRLAYYAPQTTPANRDWAFRGYEPPAPPPAPTIVLVKQESLPPPPTITLREETASIHLRDPDEPLIPNTLSPESETAASYYQPRLDEDVHPHFAPIRQSTDVKSLERRDSQQFREESAETQADSRRDDIERPFPALMQPDIPEEYKLAAEQEHLDPNVLQPFFSDDGFIISKAISALRYRKDVMEEFKCVLQVSREGPIYKLTNLLDNKSRLLLPELRIEHSPAASSLDCFADYKWPQGDRQLLDMKHTEGVMAFFCNLREPIYFVTPGVEQQHLMDVLTIVRRVARNRNKEKQAKFDKAGYRYPATVPTPSSLTASKRKKLYNDFPDYEQSEKSFALVINDSARKLATTRAVANYYKTDQSVWVSFWSPNNKKYKRKHLRVFMHPQSPALIVSDKKGKVVTGILNCENYSCASVDPENDPNIPSEVKCRGKSSSKGSYQHVTYVECLDHPNRMYFSFETTELLKDFQQVVATVSYMQQFESTTAAFNAADYIDEDDSEFGNSR